MQKYYQCLFSTAHEVERGRARIGVFAILKSTETSPIVDTSKYKDSLSTKDII